MESEGLCPKPWPCGSGWRGAQPFSLRGPELPPRNPQIACPGVTRGCAVLEAKVSKGPNATQMPPFTRGRMPNTRRAQSTHVSPRLDGEEREPTLSQRNPWDTG